MTPQKLFDEYVALPVEAQRQVADLIAFLQHRYTASQTIKEIRQTELKRQPFIGMWHNRPDFSDSSSWVRRTRESEWGKDM